MGIRHTWDVHLLEVKKSLVHLKAIVIRNSVLRGVKSDASDDSNRKESHDQVFFGAALRFLLIKRRVKADVG